MVWDVLIRDGLVFDGHGGPPRREDVAVSGARVVARGHGLPRHEALDVVDAAGRWVIPGMLDIHTHVDLEVELDPSLSEVVRHGTTTTVMSNCSLGLAFGAQRAKGGNPIVDCFARVENVPKHVLEKVVERVDWEDSGGYLRHLEQVPLGANVVPMVPHSMLRIEVMGLRDSISRGPTRIEIDEMARLIDVALGQGYAGFSTDALPFHYLANDPNRREKLPSQWCTWEELGSLTDVVRHHDRVWQATPPKDDELEVLRTFLLSGGRFKERPLKLTAVAALDLHANRASLGLTRLLSRIVNSRLVDGHFRFQALAAPFKVWGDGPITPLFEEIAPLRELNEPDLEDRGARRRLTEDPAWRGRLRSAWMAGKDGRGLAGLRYRYRIEDVTFRRDLDEMIVDGGPAAAWDGLSLGEVLRRLRDFRAGEGRFGSRDEEEAAALRQFGPIHDETDFLAELFRVFDLELRWYQVAANRDRERTKGAAMDEAFLPGFSDSGAHLTNMAFYDVNLRGLQMAAEDGLRQVARHVHRVTEAPARFFGLDVGTLDLGATADLAIVDPEALSGWDPDATTLLVHREEFDNRQMVNRPDGVVTDVLVGGTVAWRDGEATPELGKRQLGRALTVR